MKNFLIILLSLFLLPNIAAAEAIYPDAKITHISKNKKSKQKKVKRLSDDTPKKGLLIAGYYITTAGIAVNVIAISVIVSTPLAAIIIIGVGSIVALIGLILIYEFMRMLE